MPSIGNKSKVLTVRLSPKELDLIEEWREAKGFSSQSDVIRYSLSLLGLSRDRITNVIQPRIHPGENGDATIQLE